MISHATFIMHFKLASFPGLPWPQFLVVCSIKNWDQERPGNKASLKFITQFDLLKIRENN